MRLYENKFPLATARKDRLMERLVNEALTISFIENEGELNSKGHTILCIFKPKIKKNFRF